MWALTRLPFFHPEVAKELAQWQQKNDWRSSVWLLPQQLPYFGLKRVSGTRSIAFPSKLLFNPGEVDVYPISFVPRPLQVHIFGRSPPPFHSARAPLVVSQKNSDFLWRKATADEVAGSSFYQRTAAPDLMGLLASSELCQVHRQGIGENVQEVMNAQQSTNPFLLDPSLEHMDWLTKEPLPPAISGGLTTTAAQYSYTSLSWLNASDAARERIPCSGEPHKIVAFESVLLQHVCQLSPTKQREILDLTPRHVLLQAMQRPFVLSKKKWMKAKTYGITLPLRREDIPVEAEEKLSHPLLWVEIKTPPAGSDALTRNRTVIKFFFNASQIVGEDAVSAVG